MSNLENGKHPNLDSHFSLAERLGSIARTGHNSETLPASETDILELYGRIRAEAEIFAGAMVAARAGFEFVSEFGVRFQEATGRFGRKKLEQVDTRTDHGAWLIRTDTDYGDRRLRSAYINGGREALYLEDGGKLWPRDAQGKVLNGRYTHMAIAITATGNLLKVTKSGSTVIDRVGPDARQYGFEADKQETGPDILFDTTKVTVGQLAAVVESWQSDLETAAEHYGRIAPPVEYQSLPVQIY